MSLSEANIRKYIARLKEQGIPLKMEESKKIFNSTQIKNLIEELLQFLEKSVDENLKNKTLKLLSTALKRPDDAIGEIVNAVNENFSENVVDEDKLKHSRNPLLKSLNLIKFLVEFEQEKAELKERGDEIDKGSKNSPYSVRVQKLNALADFSYAVKKCLDSDISSGGGLLKKAFGKLNEIRFFKEVNAPELSYLSFAFLQCGVGYGLEKSGLLDIYLEPKLKDGANHFNAIQCVKEISDLINSAKNENLSGLEKKQAVCEIVSKYEYASDRYINNLPDLNQLLVGVDGAEQIIEEANKAREQLKNAVEEQLQRSSVSRNMSWVNVAYRGKETSLTKAVAACHDAGISELGIRLESEKNLESEKDVSKFRWQLDAAIKKSFSSKENGASLA